jgi:two-component system response regulator AlgR
VKVLVVDDEPLARARLRRMLEGGDASVEVREAGNGMDAIAENAAFEPDVVLLDIRMPGMDGIEAARHMAAAAHPPAVVFCTAYEEYAVRAFEARAVGYLLKPVQRERLEAALASARVTTRLQLQALAGAAREQRRFLSSRGPSGTRLVEVAEVRLLVADHKYVSALHPGGSLLLDDSLRELEQEFPDRFLRIHRNALAALAHVEGLQRTPGGETVLLLRGIDERPVVSRRHLGGVRERIERL